MIEQMLYKVNMTDFISWVTVEEARSIEHQYLHDAPVIIFEDIWGSRTFIPRADYHGHWQTSPSIREAADEFRTAMKEEESRNKTSWEDGE